MRKIALLSNVNIDPVINNITSDYEVYRSSGYGNVFEEIMNKNSTLVSFQPSVIYIILDITELCTNCIGIEQLRNQITTWFSLFRNCIDNQITYFVSDADARTYDMEINIDEYANSDIEYLWNQCLMDVMKNYKNIFKFPYKKQSEKIGKDNFYSDKLWYLGRIIHTGIARDSLIEEIYNCMHLLEVKQKKVLLLDLDNTLWGGIIGEGEKANIKLSNEKTGLIYKELQKVILKIKNTGVLLGIVSKNNYVDAITIIRSHPHMILREEDFVIKKINWTDKNINILEISKEINLSLDSFVFFDDNPIERELVKTLLPEVVVPVFPDSIELLPKIMEQIYTNYFKKLIFTEEDKERTAQYLVNVKRTEIQKEAVDFASFLKGLNITVNSIEPQEHIERLYQLLNKTNQFNLTTHRYTMVEVENLLADANKLTYMFEVADKFGNNGITAIVIIFLSKEANIDTFILSCRIMGKYIENYILDFIENDLLMKGYTILKSKYVKTSKSKPVEDFYERMGYEVEISTNNYKMYRINILTKPEREYYVQKELNRYE